VVDREQAGAPPLQWRNQMWRQDIDPQIEKIGLQVPNSEAGRIIH